MTKRNNPFSGEERIEKGRRRSGNDDDEKEDEEEGFDSDARTSFFSISDIADKRC